MPSPLLAPRFAWHRDTVASKPYRPAPPIEGVGSAPTLPLPVATVGFASPPARRELRLVATACVVAADVIGAAMMVPRTYRDAESETLVTFEALSPPWTETITSTIMSKETNYPNLRQTRDGSNRFVRLRGCRGARPQGAALNAAPQVARVLFGASAREDGRSPAPA
jgi:hypothetical protein